MSARLAEKVRALDALLRLVARDFAPAALASSLSAEDQVLNDAILPSGLPIEIFTLDTGRLHQHTLDVIDANRATGAFILIDESTHQTVAAGMIDA